MIIFSVQNISSLVLLWVYWDVKCVHVGKKKSVFCSANTPNEVFSHHQHQHQQLQMLSFLARPILKHEATFPLAFLDHFLLSVYNTVTFYCHFYYNYN
jgi:hypothetical protein